MQDPIRVDLPYLYFNAILLTIIIKNFSTHTKYYIKLNMTNTIQMTSELFLTLHLIIKLHLRFLSKT